MSQKSYQRVRMRVASSSTGQRHDGVPSMMQAANDVGFARERADALACPPVNSVKRDSNWLGGNRALGSLPNGRLRPEARFFDMADVTHVPDHERMQKSKRDLRRVSIT